MNTEIERYPILATRAPGIPDFGHWSLLYDVTRNCLFLFSPLGTVGFLSTDTTICSSGSSVFARIQIIGAWTWANVLVVVADP